MGSVRITPLRRARHLVSDAVFLGWAVVWWFVGWTLKSVVDVIAGPFTKVGDTTNSMAGNVSDAAAQVAKIPLVGDQLARQFDPIATALRGMTEQSAAQAATIHTLAWWLFAIVFLMPVLTVAMVYLPGRIRRAREASAALRYIDSQADLDLFALRALSNAPMTKLAVISSDPVKAWRDKDLAVIDQLAAMELARVGIGVLRTDRPQKP